MKKKSEPSGSSHRDPGAACPATGRRGVLKRIAAGGATAGAAAAMPSAWTRPVVESIVLPAHAQLSAAGCTAAEGCYAFDGEFSGTLFWPGGGPGPFDAEIFLEPGCEGRSFIEPVVVASTLAEAEELLSCGRLGAVELPIESQPDGCSFYQCEQENCLLNGTDVLLPDRRLKPIEALAVGDFVASLDRASGTIAPAVVTRIVKNHMRDHYWRINGSLRITNDHPVLTVDGTGFAWRRVDALAEGVAIQGVRDGTTITSLERVIERVATVYVETTADNFIAAPAGAAFVVKAGYGSALGRERGQTTRDAGARAPAAKTTYAGSSVGVRGG